MNHLEVISQNMIAVQQT